MEKQKQRFIFGGAGLAALGAIGASVFGGSRELTKTGKPRFLGGIINSVKGMFGIRELAKIERHAKQRGLTVDQYLEKKHGAAAKEWRRNKDLAEYVAEQQARREMKYGEGGKSKANRGASSDSSEDSEDE